MGQRADLKAEDFESWVAVRGEQLLRLAYVLTGDMGDAEDLVQEALSKALPRWSRIRRVDHPEAYVRRMLINAHTSRWRRIGRREVRMAQIPDQPTPAEPGVEMEERVRLWQACLALPPHLRVAVVLRFYEQLEYAEIAALTGLREGSVRARVSRGIARLRAEMGESHE